MKRYDTVKVPRVLLHSTNSCISLRRRRVFRTSGRIAFTLVELLIVIAIVAVLAALLLTALSRAKAQANSATCVNHLHQMGMALKMYLDDNQFRYPYAVGPGEADGGNLNPAAVYNLFWFSKLRAYYPLDWTNAAYHCPGYNGPIIGILNGSGPRGSYAYNFRGVRTGFTLYTDPVSGFPVNYGLGPIVRAITLPLVAEATVKVPSEMFAIGESRFRSLSVNGQGGFWGMLCGELHTNNVSFDPARHGKNYNTVFCDGHVAGMNPWVLFNPSDTASMWNYDHQPHPELWTP